MANFVMRAWRGLFGGSSSASQLEPEVTRSLHGTGSMLAHVSSNRTTPTRGTLEVLRSYKRTPWVRSINDRISGAVANVKPQLFRVRGDTRVEISDHPVLDLLKSPNPQMSGKVMFKLVQTYLDLDGNCYLLIERAANRQPAELFPIPPHWIQEHPSDRNDFVYVFSSGHGQTRRIPAEDMIWLRILDPVNPYGRGTGIGEALGDEIDTDEYASKHVKSWFYNRATPDIIVSIKGISAEQAKLAQQRWEDANRGPFRAGRAHFTSGEMTVKQLSQTFAEMQLIPLREFERNTGVETYGLPPEILGIISNSNRATIEAADHHFAKWTVTPRVDFVFDELNRQLLPFYGDPSLELDHESIIPGDKEHALAVMKGSPTAFKANEWRKAADVEPLDDAENLHIIPSNIQALAPKLSEDVELLLEPDPTPAPAK